MTVTINFTTQSISAHTLGRIGEHNATTLVITPPTELSEDSRTTHYRVAFGVREDVVLTEAFTEIPIEVSLSKQITKASRLSLQVIAYDSEGNYVGKSDKLSGFCLAPSVEGTEISADGSNSDIAWEIVALEEKVDAVDGRMTLAESEILELQNTKANNAVELAETSTTSKYTRSEVLEMFASGQAMTINSYPVVTVYDRYNIANIVYINNSQNNEIWFSKAEITNSKGLSFTAPYNNLMTLSERAKLSGIENGANKYVLPPATDSVLGGIKVGDNLTVEEDGTLNATGGEQAQADWSQADNTAPDYIKNKPTNVSAFSNDAGYITESKYIEIWDNGNTAKYTKSEIEIMVSQKKPMSYQGHPVLLARSEEDGSKVNLYYLTSTDGSPKWNPIVYRISVDAQKNIVTDIPANNLFSGKYSDLTGLPTFGAVATSNDYNDLDNKPTIPTVPTNVSAFNNDAGYLTSHQDISGKENKGKMTLNNVENTVVTHTLSVTDGGVTTTYTLLGV